MGSYIQLEIDSIGLDYGKNQFWTHHGQLFQEKDYSAETTDSVDPAEEECGAYSRTLLDLVGRLELLGYSLPACKQYVIDNAPYWCTWEPDPEDDGGYTYEKVDPNWILETASNVNLDLVIEARDAVSAQYFNSSRSGVKVDTSLATDWIKRIQKESDIDWIPTERFIDALHFLHLSITSPHASPIDELCHPYVTLRLLANNTGNHKRSVIWDHSDMVLGGWATKFDFEPYCDPTSNILIVTEGSSDSSVIEKALAQIRPEIADFFSFVDMKDNYPFTGTGNLYRFAQGLASIKMQNKIVLIYDDDAEGNFNYRRTCELSLPDTMGVIKLPTLDDFRSYPTVGPEGNMVSDICGKAVSIELFLGGRDCVDDPPVRWTSFHEKSQVYQGSLDDKRSILKTFLNAKQTALDFPRLPHLLDKIVQESVRVSVVARRIQETGNTHPWSFGGRN